MHGYSKLGNTHIFMYNLQSLPQTTGILGYWDMRLLDTGRDTWIMGTGVLE